MSYLFFADDILLFTEAWDDQVECIKEGLRSFCNISGQKINFNKSLIFFSSNLPKQVALSLSTGMGVPRALNLGFYLGHHIVHQGHNGRAHKLLTEKARRHLDGWKTKCLPRVGRITLAKSILNSMGIFQMQY